VKPKLGSKRGSLGLTDTFGQNPGRAENESGQVLNKRSQVHLMPN
jgi:hypothetical protein